VSLALEKNEVVRKQRALREELAFALPSFARNRGVLDSFSKDEMTRYSEKILLRMQLNKEDRFARILKHAEGKVESMQEVLKMLDLHEFLDRVVKRIVEPQREIVSSFNQLLQITSALWSFCGLVPTVKCPRLQLDEPLQEMAIAMEGYATKAHEVGKRGEFLGSLLCQS
jgi:hypothetical protein